MRRDNRKVIDEAWGDARVPSFLDKQPPDLLGDADFHVRVFACRGLRVAYFERSLNLCVQAGGDVRARRNGAGQGVATHSASHAQAEPHRELLAAAGARA